jgi:hypothetical protein
MKSQNACVIEVAKAKLIPSLAYIETHKHEREYQIYVKCTLSVNVFSVYTMYHACGNAIYMNVPHLWVRL